MILLAKGSVLKRGSIPVYTSYSTLQRFCYRFCCRVSPKSSSMSLSSRSSSSPSSSSSGRCFCSSERPPSWKTLAGIRFRLLFTELLPPSSAKLSKLPEIITDSSSAKGYTPRENQKIFLPWPLAPPPPAPANLRLVLLPLLKKNNAQLSSPPTNHAPRGKLPPQQINFTNFNQIKHKFKQN